ncbi:unnamed protein product [Calypogeia fissa]
MAAASSDCTDEEVVRQWGWNLSPSLRRSIARWTRVSGLGTEAGLREIGCPEETIAETLKRLHPGRVTGTPKLIVDLGSVLTSLAGTKDGPAVLLATLGRGNTSYMSKVALRMSNPDAFVALCVNMSSNTNIKELDLSGNSAIRKSPMGINLFAIALKTNSSLEKIKLGSCLIDGADLMCLIEGLTANKTLASLDL